MTLERIFSKPAQLVIDGKAIDVMVQTATTRNEEIPIEKIYKSTDSNGEKFCEAFTVGKNIQTITTFECVKIENRTIL